MRFNVIWIFLGKLKKEFWGTAEKLSCIANRCIHAIDKAMSRLFGFLNDTEHISGENEKNAYIKRETVSILSNQIRSGKDLKKDTDFEHDKTYFNKYLKDIYKIQLLIFLKQGNKPMEMKRQLKETLRKYLLPQETEYLSWRNGISSNFHDQ